jgi:hypothetical protein
MKGNFTARAGIAQEAAANASARHDAIPASLSDKQISNLRVSTCERLRCDAKLLAQSG